MNKLVDLLVNGLRDELATLDWLYNNDESQYNALAKSLGRKYQTTIAKLREIIKKHDHIVNVVGCARCGDSHTGLKFDVLSNHDKYTHWAMCPTLNQPIMILDDESTI